MCARNECDSSNRTRTKKTNNYAHIHVFTKCVTSLLGFNVLRVDVSLDLGFSRGHWCRTSHRSAGRFYTSTSFHHAYAIPSTKFFLLDVVVRLCPVIVNSICIPNSFHMSHRENGSFEVLSLHHPTVTVDRRQL